MPPIAVERCVELRLEGAPRAALDRPMKASEEPDLPSVMLRIDELVEMTKVVNGEREDALVRARFGAIGQERHTAAPSGLQGEHPSCRRNVSEKLDEEPVGPSQ